MKDCHISYPREMVRLHIREQLNENGSRTRAILREMEGDRILVIETVSVNVRIPESTPLPEIARFQIFTGSACPAEMGTPVVDIPMTRMATDPEGKSISYVAVENMRVYAAGEKVQCTLDMSSPTSGRLSVNVFGYLVSAESPSLAP